MEDAGAMKQLVAPPPFPGAKAPFEPERGFPHWPSLVAASGEAWSRAVSGAQGPKVLICSNTGMHGAVATFDSVLQVGLTFAGARVESVLCDGVLPGCLMATCGEATPPDLIAERGLTAKLCKHCFNRGTRVARPLGLGEHRLSAYLTSHDYTEAESLAREVSLAELPGWKLDDLAVGEHAFAGALRYFATGDLTDQPRAAEIARRYLEGAILVARAYDRLLSHTRPDVAVLHHGIYSPQGIAADVCRQHGVRVVTWVVAYRKNCFIFSHDDTYHHTMMTEPISAWEGLALTDDQRARVSDYLASRASGGRDWIYFHRETEHNFAEFASARGVNASKPIISILTNVMWDAQLHYPANAFSSMREWIVETLSYFVQRSDLEVIVRVHPAEVRGALPSRQRISDVIADEFPELPGHIHIVGPDEDASTYALAAASNAVIIYGTKMGTELTPLGIPVIVAGEAWIRNKGLTRDASDRSHYLQILSELPLSEDQWRPDTERALRYSFHFFFRRMIPLPFLEPNGTGAMFGLELDGIDDLAPGRWPGLDVITSGIMHNAPFVYPAEQHGVHDAPKQSAGAK